MIQPGEYQKSKTTCLPQTVVLPSADKLGFSKFVTIDDIENMAKNLLINIEVLKSYKYPLAVRKGIILSKK